ncbi:hypothetical protein CJ030_MR4G011749 [Morella rubra]|uniref:Uncharacterized protein n=1 Tax=Morella rubra TaxID=262757 RepID=A0A6A1VT51_9ROSI|nr:hypothetical protein CJ030_MR4G011749 [Morella rubra]
MRCSDGIWTEVPYRYTEESAINKKNRAKLKIVHTSGARSFQCARALLEKMEAVQLQHKSEGKSYTKVEIFTEDPSTIGQNGGKGKGKGRRMWQRKRKGKT